MELKDIARELPEEIRTVFEPILPPVIWGGNADRPRAAVNASTPCSTSWSAASPGRCSPAASPRTRPSSDRSSGGWSAPPSAPPGGNSPSGTSNSTGSTGTRSSSTAPRSRQKRGRTDRPFAGRPGQERHGLAPGPRQPGHAAGRRDHGSNANDGCQAQDVLEALVIRPPQPRCPAVEVVPRSLPTARADGAYGNGPTRRRTEAAGFRLQSPGRGQKQPGVGRIRQSVERCHDFFARFGRIARRWDRSARRYLGWVELAACIIFIRPGFVR
jgi:hypothetical protein